ncbi:hypothetical protein HHK36_005631 [Tetracentron sinense]|uniref:Uncharacterized protein n=1 Tax=Tetracentron sinense TaxID=13715 RepID=A0A834ZQQ1_TETSI|nr:hypothetical protein HHK36_005631 [Tetracentron sinense]
MSLLRRPYAYSKMEIEDPEERTHRRAQFLIYKVMQQADSRRRPSSLRVKICKLKVKIGKRLKRLRKSMSVTISVAKVDVYKQAISRQWKTWRRLLRGTETIVSLPLFS